MAQHLRKITLLLFPLVLLVSCARATPTQRLDGVVETLPLDASLEPGDMEQAHGALVAYFEALYRGDYQTAANYYGGSYYNLRWMYPDVDPDDRAALLASACLADSRYAFRCWRVKDVLEAQYDPPDTYALTVRFADEQGNLLTGGDNRTATPCQPPDCPRTKYLYTVVKTGGEFRVMQLLVCLGCWP
jgi:hypothetical protein